MRLTAILSPQTRFFETLTDVFDAHDNFVVSDVVVDPRSISKAFFSCSRQLQVVSQAIELPKLSEAVPEQTARPPSELPVLQNLEKINEMAGVALVVYVPIPLTGTVFEHGQAEVNFYVQDLKHAEDKLRLAEEFASSTLLGSIRAQARLDLQNK